MLEIANVKLSKNTVNAGEKYVISVDINEIIDYVQEKQSLKSR